MKILVVGVFNENSTNNGIANGFKNAGHEVFCYNYREREGLVGSDNRDREIIDLCKSGGYGLVFFCKCNGVSDTVIGMCNKYTGGGRTFLWYMDPLNGNYNKELRDKMEAVSHVGIAKWEVYELAKEINPLTHFLIEGFDPKWDYPIECEEIYDVSFIGNPYGDRKEWLDQLKNVTILSDKYNTEHSKAVGQSGINLNFTGGGGISDRVYKILAAGGFCLSQNYPHVEKYGLVPDEDLVLFNTPEEMVEKCNYYLPRYTERNKIAEHGYQTVQKFSRDNLAKEIVEIVRGQVGGLWGVKFEETMIPYKKT